MEERVALTFQFLDGGIADDAGFDVLRHRFRHIRGQAPLDVTRKLLACWTISDCHGCDPFSLPTYKNATHHTSFLERVFGNPMSAVLALWESRDALVEHPLQLFPNAANNPALGLANRMFRHSQFGGDVG